MLQTVLYAIGRGLRAAGLAVLHLLWEVIVEIVRGLAQGTRDVLRRAMPWVMGLTALWMLMVFAPQLFQALLQLGILCSFCWYMVTRVLFPKPAAKKKKG